MTREHQWKILQGLSSQQKIQFPDFRKINRDERFKEIDEKRQQKLRKPNIMVFSRYENSEVGDDQFVRELIKDVGVDLNIKFENWSKN